MRGRQKLGAAILAGFLAAFAAAAPPVAAQSPPASKRAEAQSQLARADKLRAGLEGQPQKERGKREYDAVLTAYRRVVHAGPATSEAQTALVAIAEIYQEMGRGFDDAYFQKAIDTYQALLKQYPATRYRSDAMFTIAKIQQEDLDQPDEAEKSFDQFLTRYPHSQKAATAQDALKSIAAERDRAAARSSGAANGKAVAEDRARDRRMPQVTGIREWNAENYTRVVISLEDEVKYQAARIANPDRIYFDLYTARLSSALAGKTLDVQNGFLKSVRVAQNHEGVVRVVLEVEKVKDYSVFLLKDPYRLVVDVYGESTTAKATHPAAGAAEKTTEESAGNSSPSGRKNSAKGSQEANAAPSKPAESGGGKQVAEKTPGPAAKAGSSKEHNRKPSKAEKNDESEAAGSEVADNAAPAENVHGGKSARGESHDGSGNASDSAAPEQPSIAKPTHQGERSLTRTLGLKIGKIVIDPGHGGHDTGTIGPTGLEEKDLTLDVALRLGKLIEQKLGAQVVYTRTDDTFVPLEERTAIANQAKADLFISIHANSSDEASTRGIETFYLNLTDSEEARQVAARENALAQASIHDLQSLVEKIARNEKIDESRELAIEVQNGLTKRMQRYSHQQRNRGVKRAPFVVLLGANMPSILTEIGFISNPTDEAALKKSEQRQRVAEGLLAGITHYLENLGSGPHTAAMLAAHSSATDR